MLKFTLTALPSVSVPYTITSKVKINSTNKHTSSGRQNKISQKHLNKQLKVHGCITLHCNY